MIWLKLSKVPSAARRTTPPFGACGLTWSKCLKSGGYLGSPNSDRPCCHRGSEFCARAGVVGNGAWPNQGETAASAPVRRMERRVRRKGHLREARRPAEWERGDELCPILVAPPADE